MNRRAFTLIEAIVVIIVIAVLAGVALPYFSDSLSRASLRSSADGLLDAAQYLGRMSVLERRDYRLVLIKGSGDDSDGYRVEVATADLDAPATFEAVTQGAVKPTRLSAPIAFGDVLIDNGGADSGERFVTFRADGSADAAVIQVTNGRSTVSILIEPTLGRVQRVEGATRRMPNLREDLDA